MCIQNSGQRFHNPVGNESYIIVRQQNPVRVSVLQQIPDSYVVPRREASVFSGKDNHIGNLPLQRCRLICRSTVVYDDNLVRNRNPAQLPADELYGQVIGTVTDDNDTDHRPRSLLILFRMQSFR